MPINRARSIRRHAKFAYMFCFFVFILYFDELCQFLSLTRTDLQLKPPASHRFPHFIVCVPSDSLFSNLSAGSPSVGDFRRHVMPRMVRKSVKSLYQLDLDISGLEKQNSPPQFECDFLNCKRPRSQPIPLGMFLFDGRICDVYHVFDWPASAHLLLHNSWADQTMSLSIFSYHPSEMWISKWHELSSTDIDSSIELVVLHARDVSFRSQNSCHPWPFIINQTRSCPFLLQNESDASLIDLPTALTSRCVVHLLYRSCDHQQYHLSRINPNQTLMSNATFAIHFQDPFMFVVSYPLLSIASFLWFTSQLMSTFVGITLLHEIRQFPVVLQQSRHIRILFNRKPFLQRFLTKIVWLIPFLLYYFQTRQLIWQFKYQNLSTRQQINLQSIDLPNFAVSVCVSHTALRHPNVTRFCAANKLVVLPDTDSQIRHLLWTESCVQRIFQTSLNHSEFYFRRRFTCLRFQLHNHQQPTYLIQNDLNDQLLSPYLFTAESKIFLNQNHVRFYIHAFDDFPRTEKQQTVAQVLLTKIFIEERVPSSGCIDYRIKLNCTSRQHCIEKCLLHSYVLHHGYIPTHVSYVPSQYPSHWAQFTLQDRPDIYLQEFCKSKCNQTDCLKLIYRPNYYRKSLKTSIFVPKQTSIVEAQQVYTFPTLEFALQMLALVNFCFGINPYRLLRLLTQGWHTQHWFQTTFQCFTFLITAVLVYLHVRNSLDQEPVVNTSFGHVSIGTAPNIHICRRHNSSAYDEEGRPLSLLLLKKYVQLQYTLPNQTITSYEFLSRFSPNRTEFSLFHRIIRSPNLTCFQFIPMFQVNFTLLQGKQSVLYDIKVTHSPTLPLHVGSSHTHWPVFFFEQPSQMTFLNIWVGYRQTRLCNTYEFPREQMLLGEIKQLLWKGLERPLSKQHLLHKVKRLQKKIQLPDCRLSQYMPIMMKELVSESPNVSWYRVMNSDLQIKVIYTDSFSYSHFIIFLFTILEIFMNITFNHSIMVLFARIPICINFRYILAQRRRLRMKKSKGKFIWPTG